MFFVYGKRYKNHAPILDSKTGEVLDDGTPKVIVLGRWDDERIAKSFASNIKSNVPLRSWNIWVEQKQN